MTYKHASARVGSIMLLALFVSSCGSLKKITYFREAEKNHLQKAVEARESIIEPGDILYITVSSPFNPEAVTMFNQPAAGSYPLNVSGQALSLQGYPVDKEGNINFPALGKTRLAGMTKNEAADYLTGKISVYAKEPTVNVRFLNFKITVLGEVARPGTYTISDERISVIEALGLAGDMTIYGKRTNVLVYGQAEGKQYVRRMDVTSPDIFDAEGFYLQQNDVVYVQPNRARAGSAAYNQYLQVGLSLLSLLVTVLALTLK